MSHEHCDSAAHTHKDERGILVKCYHQCKSVLTTPAFWIGTIVSTTLTYPFEHFLWEHVWPFKLLTEFMAGGH